MRDRRRTSERGQTVVLVALLMTGLLAATGLAIDGGMTMKLRRDAQNASDGGALRGAQELSTRSSDHDVYHDDVLRAVNDLVERNGIEDTNDSPGDEINDHVTVYLVDENGDVLAPVQPGGPKVSDDANGVAVQVRFERPTSFIQVVGIRELPAQAFAVAQTGQSSGVPGGEALYALSHVTFRPWCGEEGCTNVFVVGADEGEHEVEDDWVEVTRRSYTNGADMDVWYRFQFDHDNSAIKFEEPCIGEYDECSEDPEETPDDGLGDEGVCEAEWFTIILGGELDKLEGFNVNTKAGPLGGRPPFGAGEDYTFGELGSGNAQTEAGFYIQLIGEVTGPSYTFKVSSCNLSEITASGTNISELID